MGKVKNRSDSNGAAPVFRLVDLEEAELVFAVADQKVLGLLVVVEHHLVSLATDT